MRRIIQDNHIQTVFLIFLHFCSQAEGRGFHEFPVALDLSESGGWDSNPRKTGLQPIAVTTVPPPR